MAGYGPVPKRSNQRRRRNKSGGDVDSVLVTGEVKPPSAKREWHPIARDWFNALKRSGQSAYYEPSDWAVAALLAESMSRDLNEQVVGVTERGEVVKDTIPLKGASLSAYLRAMSNLLVTEGDRRRARLELERRTEEPAEADVSELEDFRRRLKVGQP